MAFSRVASNGTESVAVQRPRRWDSPFGEEMTDGNVDAILASRLFRSIDPDQFPAALSLRDIVRNDARVVHYSRGDIVVREGDYGGSMFVILEGSLRVLLDAEGSRHFGGQTDRQVLSLTAAFLQPWTNSRVPEVRSHGEFQGQKGIALREPEPGRARTYIEDVDAVIARYNSVELGEGEVFGEIAALSRSPRTATVFAETDSTLVELRWQGLRDIRRRDQEFRIYVDQLYRSRNLTHHLRQVALFRDLDDEALEEIAAGTSLESHGDFEWYGTFREISDRGSAEAIELEPVISEEEHVSESLIVVRSGFARISRRLDHGHRTIGYLTTNETFGLEEIVARRETGEPQRLKNTLRAVGFVDVFRIPADLIERLVLPKASAKAVSSIGSDERGSIDQTLLDALVDDRIINGTRAMLIDNDRCVRCDACVDACATTHDGNPRFVRHGPSHAQLMFANACMHCVDPVCLIGCPTGAIRRTLEGPIVIHDPTCIGCGTCADSCPYHNIRMVEARDEGGAILVDDESRQPILKATKCDLCSSQPAGPACERACPHDALIRVDLRDRERLSRWINGRGRKWRRTRNSIVTAVALVLVAGAVAVIDDSLNDASFFSGWLLLASIAILALFGVRKRIPTLPLGNASSWTQLHIFLGFFSAGVFFLHTGAGLPKGTIESGLWLLVMAVTLSGIGGLILSRWIPRRLTASGEQILFDRIPIFRARLEAAVEELAMQSVRETASASIADFYQTSLAAWLAGPGNGFSHLIGSSAPLERIRLEIRHLERYLDERGREILAKIDEHVVAKDNLDHQYALQRVLRGWKLIHGPATWALMLFIVVHVVMVYAFAG